MLAIYRKKCIELLDQRGIYVISSSIESKIKYCYEHDVPAQECVDRLIMNKRIDKVTA